MFCLFVSVSGFLFCLLVTFFSSLLWYVLELGEGEMQIVEYKESGRVIVLPQRGRGFLEINYDLVGWGQEVLLEHCLSFVVVTIIILFPGSTNVGDQLPTGQLSVVPWRRTGVKYTNNEAYFDVIEEIDAIIDKSGMGVAFGYDKGKLSWWCQKSDLCFPKRWSLISVWEALFLCLLWNVASL